MSRHSNRISRKLTYVSSPLPFWPVPVFLMECHIPDLLSVSGEALPQLSARYLNGHNSSTEVPRCQQARSTWCQMVYPCNRLSICEDLA